MDVCGTERNATVITHSPFLVKCCHVFDGSLIFIIFLKKIVIIVVQFEDISSMTFLHIEQNMSQWHYFCFIHILSCRIESSMTKFHFISETHSETIQSLSETTLKHETMGCWHDALRSWLQSKVLDKILFPFILPKDTFIAGQCHGRKALGRTILFGKSLEMIF